jgi:hypothetical protein
MVSAPGAYRVLEPIIRRVLSTLVLLGCLLFSALPTESFRIAKWKFVSPRRIPVPPPTVVTKGTRCSNRRRNGWSRLWAEPFHGDNKDASPSNRGTDTRPILVVDWDGCLVENTVDWRIAVGIQAAAQTWPSSVHLPDDTSWLRNKLTSLAHVLIGPPPDSTATSQDASMVDVSTTVEYALCVRLLLEEQALDQGRSVGKSGKYASQFHPQSDDTTTLTTTTTPFASDSFSPNHGRNERSSRPLTVGEIGENWRETLREATIFRYHVNYQNPLPLLQNNTGRILQDIHMMCNIPALQVDEQACRALQTLASTAVVIVVAHKSEVAIACDVLQQYAGSEHCDWKIRDKATECFGQYKPSQIHFLPRSAQTLRDILQALPAGSSRRVHLIESSWPALQSSISCFGDTIPRARSIYPYDSTAAIVPTILRGASYVPDVSLALHLATWTAVSHPTPEAAATMNAWTNVLNLHDFEALCRALCSKTTAADKGR